MIGIPAEKIDVVPEKAAADGWDAWARPASPVLDGFFDVELSELHGVDAAPGSDPWRACGGRPGRTLAVEPGWGTGCFWYYALDDCMALSIYDVTFSRHTGFDSETLDCFGLGSYGRGITPYFDVAGSPADRTLLGYVWPAQRHAVDIPAGTTLDVTSIVLLDEGAARMAAQLGRHPSVMARAFATLDGTRPIPAVTDALEQARAARPSPRQARCYYEAKIVEALCLLMDWYDAEGADVRPVAPEDRAAVDRARRHLAEHLDRAVDNEELARVALVSPSKLARLFKRVEGTTPQGCARELRLERACRLLRETDLPLGEVAAQVGFARQGSLSEAFRARFGCTPRAYRKGAGHS